MKISVVIPVYNVEKYLEQCLESVLAQTYREFEIILVNDGSTDLSLDICKKFESKDSRIKVIDKSNGGVVSAWKCGVENAYGEYIAFIDSDDYIMPTYLENLIEAALNDSEAVIIAENAMRLTAAKELIVWNVNSIKEGKVYFDEDYYKTLLTDYGSFSRKVGLLRWGRLIKKQRIIEVLEFCDDKVSFGDDQMLITAIILQGGHAVCIDRNDYIYRCAEQSITQGFKPDIFERHFILYEAIRCLPNIEIIDNAQTQLNTLLVDGLAISFLHFAQYKKPIRKKAKIILKNETVKRAMSDCYTDKMSKFNKLMYKVFKSNSPFIIGIISKMSNIYLKLKKNSFYN